VHNWPISLRGYRFSVREFVRGFFGHSSVVPSFDSLHIIDIDTWVDILSFRRPRPAPGGSELHAHLGLKGNH